MNIAIDTNVIVYALAGNAEAAAKAAAALEEVATQGAAMVVAAPVYAELLAIPNSTKENLDAFIAEAKICVDWRLSEACWTAAGTAYAAYARRRKRQKVDVPRRILADFIIGAHATGVGRLLTADTAFYRTNFPELRVVAP